MPDSHSIKTRRLHPFFTLLCACLLILSTLFMLASLYMQRTQLGQSIGHDSFSLLPKGHRGLSDADEALVQTALAKQSESANRQVIFLISSDSPESTHAAKTTFETQLNASAHSLLSPSPIQSNYAQSLLDYYAKHTLQLATPNQLNKLAHYSDAQWVEEVQKNASRPISVGPSLAQDPLGNVQDWLLTQAGKSGIYQGANGDWQVDYEGKTFAVLLYQTAEDGFALQTDEPLTQVLEQVKTQTLQHDPNTMIHMAGIPLHVAAATEQANREVSWFGTISTVAVILLLTLAYHSARAVFAVTFSLLYGMLLAFFVTRWAFGQVHILTLVFGTSLIGVAEDYGFHFLAARQNHPEQPTPTLKRHIAPGMFLAFITTILAYVFLGLPPFPALRQLAVFSVAGLLGSLLVVWYLFPYAFAKMPPPTPLNRLFAAWWRGFVAFSPNIPRQVQYALWAVFGIIVLLGWGQVRFKDDLRQLQNSPNWLMAEQRLVGQALNEANSQFFLVTGDSAQSVLTHEEDLRAKLDEQFVAHPELKVRYRAVSEWLPSVQRQQQTEQASLKAIPALEAQLGLDTDLSKNAGQYIEPQTWLSQPFAPILQRQWLGQQADGRWATLLSLTGQTNSGELSVLQKATVGLPHVIWVDNVTHYGQLLANYRNIILLILALSYVATLVVLWPRYRSNALLLLVPPLVGTLLSLSALGWLGIHIQLFTVLPLLLILGMGIDYGIFLLEHVDEQERMWMVTCLSTISTILSLGMLGFSSTPALHILGLTLALGISLTWLTSAWVGKYLSRHLRAQ